MQRLRLSRVTGVRQGLRDGVRGFTLIEVLIVVVLIAVLLGIALPSYQETMNKGRRSDAKAALKDAVNRQEQYMLDHSRYAHADELDDLGFELPAESEEGHYAIARVATADCADNADLCFVMRATPNVGSPQAKDGKCTSFTIEHTGLKSATGSNSDECW